MSTETPEQATQRYKAAAHAMQTGVAAKMNYDQAETAPKHLRVGINSAMVEHSALAALLIEKGVISEAEYLTALADGMERERDTYAEWLRAAFGANIDLG